jgi:hypothetical protein
MRPNASTLPDYYLERYVVEDLPQETWDEIHQLVQSDESLRNRVEHIREENKAYNETYPLYESVQDIKRQYAKRKAQLETEATQRKPYGKWAFASTLTAILVVGSLLLIFYWSTAPSTSMDSPVFFESTRVKGGDPYLLIYRERAVGGERLEDHHFINEGDSLQISFIPHGNTYGVIFSIDGRGVVTLHYPYSPFESSQLPGDDQTFLDFAYQLDDAPGFERFFFVSSDKPIAIESILNQAETLAANPFQAQTAQLNLPEGIQQYSINLCKE